jgi:hypothetical protein
MPAKIIDEMKRQITEHNIIKPGFRLIGCTEEEVEHLKERQGVDFLPEVYRQFLLTFGYSRGGYFLQGEDVGYLALLELKQVAQELLERENAPPLPDDMFVFYSHHGYQFMCFATAKRDADPPIYSYVEYDEQLADVGVTLSDFYRQHLEWLVKTYGKSNRP